MDMSKACVIFSLFSVFFVQSSEIIVCVGENKDLPFRQALSRKIITNKAGDKEYSAL